MPVASTLVTTSVTYASIVRSRSAMATETRWWPSRTKYSSPMRKTSIGGRPSPSRSTRLSRSQRCRDTRDRGRNHRSKSAARLTLPTIASSGITCSPSGRSPR